MRGSEEDGESVEFVSTARTNDDSNALFAATLGSAAWTIQRPVCAGTAIGQKRHPALRRIGWIGDGQAPMAVLHARRVVRQTSNEILKLL
jgi:hypothetical protein